MPRLVRHAQTRSNAQTDTHTQRETGSRRIKRSVFVEGGASVVDALLRRPEVVDEVVVTIAPVFVGGLRPGSSPLGPMRLTGVQTLALGDDVVVRGAPS